MPFTSKALIPERPELRGKTTQYVFSLPAVSSLNCLTNLRRNDLLLTRNFGKSVKLQYGELDYFSIHSTRMGRLLTASMP